MKFQRDSRAPWRHIPRLLLCLGRSLWKRDPAQRITRADAWRGVGASRLALSLLETIDATALAPGQLFRFRLVQATALQYVGSHREARTLFDLSEREAPDDLLLSFALQHHGKCLVESGELDLARSKLEQARDLRQALGREELVASSERALEGLDQPT